ncbi:MAG: glycosyltransferase [Lachnospiraceae bacterium]|nr:glycosyltransferase [Lachnospiraceae bacterium]
MRISVIVPVYNVSAYLPRCMESLLGQDASDVEILLVDDGSTDESGALCDRYAASEARVRAFHKVNGGLSSARNYGLRNASGDYVVFVDSDDYVDKEMCRVLESRIQEASGADMVSYDGWEETEKERSSMRRMPVEEALVESGSAYLLRNYRNRNLNVEACLYAFRMDFLREESLLFREGILHEDVEFTPRALLKAKKVLTIPDGFYHYMIREGSISTGRSRTKNIEDLFATLREQCALAEQQEPELCRWMKNAILDSYLNMVYDARMYQPQYRHYIEKSFLRGKAATPWNHFRAALCMLSPRLYCLMNDLYKRLR